MDYRTVQKIQLNKENLRQILNPIRDDWNRMKLGIE